MQRQDNDRPSASPRRDFLKTAGAAAAGLYLVGARDASGAEGSTPAAGTETLALKGGKRAVTFPADKQADVFKWPPYGDAEKEVVKAALDCTSSTIYEYGPKLEKAWRDYNGVPFAKTHMNGTSALLSMYSALGYEPGTEIMVPSYTFFGAINLMLNRQEAPELVEQHARAFEKVWAHRKQLA